MSTKATARSTHAVQIENILETLRKREEATEGLGRLPESTVADLERAGLFKLLVPRFNDGYQVSLQEFMDVVVELGRADGAVAWTFSLISAHMWFAAAALPPEISKEVFESSNPRISGVIAPREFKAKSIDDGMVIEKGIWAFNTGAYHAGWDLLGIPLLNEQQQVVGAGYALIPGSDVHTLDDWSVVGMKGTGSTSVIVENVFVPREKIVDIASIFQGKYASTHLDREPLYRLALIPFLAIKDVFPILGMAKAAMELALEKIPGRPVTFTFYDQQSETPSVHIQLAKAAGLIETAELMLRDAVEKLMTAASHGQLLEQKQRVQIWCHATLATRHLWESVDSLASLTGSNFFEQRGRMNRIWRNAKVASLHAGLRPDTGLELYGAALLGKTPKSPLA